MIFSLAAHRAVSVSALAGLVLALASPRSLLAQQAPPASGESRQLDAVPLPDPALAALPLPEDRGLAAAAQDLKRLSTTASVLMIVAHPDDEDGPLLTYLSRGLGVRATLFTLTRGEGGQNVMSADTYDALGLLRTNELLKADAYYGATQLWGTEADFGFSKTQQEAFSQWSHDRVLYDAVLAVRRERPQIIVATFIGAVTDGHGQHQVSGEIAQEVFKAAGDPRVFPDQLKPLSEGGLGLTVWQPRAVYGMVPFAPVTNGKMFDYATGKWAPARFENYVTRQWLATVPSSDVAVPVGAWDAALGQSYIQIARTGWGQQKSQNGGANPTLSGPGSARYHLWAVEPRFAGKGGGTDEFDLFHNNKVDIDTGIGGLAALVQGPAPAWLTDDLHAIAAGLGQIGISDAPHGGLATAHKLAPLYRRTLALYARVNSSALDSQSKASLLFELDAKIDQFQQAFRDLLGLDLVAFTTHEERLPAEGPFRGGSADETPRSVQPGETFLVRVHTAQAASEAKLERIWLRSSGGNAWTWQPIFSAGQGAAVGDHIYRVVASANATPTEPYFTRPSIEQPYYDISVPAWRERSFAPYPLAAWAQFTFDGLPIRLGQVVQTMQRVTGPGGIYQPLVVTPAIGVRIEPDARILPLDGSPLPVRVTVHAEGPASGTVELKLPPGWHADPATAPFSRDSAGDTAPVLFSVSTNQAQTGAYSIQAIVRCNGRAYQDGWQVIGYPGLRPYNLYRPAQLKTRKIHVKIAPGLRVAYVMGPGDLVPQALEGMGITPHMLSAQEIAGANLSAWNVVVVGIRAYSTRPELAANQARLDQFVRQGGVLIVQYQSSTFPAPLPLDMGGRLAERVVDERAPVKLLDAANPLLTTPNHITTADFDGWVEERGHGFLHSWDPGYTALTETADPGQDPQRGGLLVAHPGKGTYIYVAYALYRQLPELVPGSYRLLANLLSARQTPAAN